jgi:hypothetical protein
MWEESPESKKEMAEKELTQYEALLHLLKNNNLGCHIECGGFSLGICNNSKAIPAVKHTIKEIKKAIKGESNEWE